MRAVALLLAPLLLLAAAVASAASAAGQVDVIPLNGSINPVSANYVVRGLAAAERDGAVAAVIELDTPGGLDSSMRQIIRQMTSSTIPVIVFVGPPGARAGSAGVFITEAADVAAMAPNTNIGAAHPVGIGLGSGGSSSGTPTPDVETTKVTNDAVAYIRSLAQNHGHNADWAELAVRQSVSATEREAVAQHIVDLEASNLQDLLAKIDGRTVGLSNGRQVTLHTAGATTRTTSMSAFEELMAIIADPNIAYLLMLVAVYGIISELSTPGAVLPGVLGGLALLLAMLSLGVLPVNYAGLGLIAFSLLLFVADVKMPTHGILTAGGVIAFLLGSLALFNLGSSGMSIAVPLVAGATVTTAAFFAVIVRLGLRARKAPPTTGAHQLIGKVAEVRSPLQPTGQVLIDGEWWKATSDEPVPAGARVEVLAVRGLTLWVRRAA